MKKSFVKKFASERPIRKKGLTITVSGLAGSGKTSVAESIAKSFNLKCITGGNIFRDMAKERGMTLNDFLKIVTKKEDREADKRMLKLAMQGGVVIDSRLSGFVAGQYSDYRIFITASQKERARRISGRERISQAKSLSNLIERDKGDVTRYKKLYGVDLSDISIYDLVLNNELLNRKSTAEVVKFVLKKSLSGRRE